MTVIFDPAEAAAISRCLTARSIDERGRTRLHPRPCGWCVDDLATLRALVEGFNAWAEFDDRANTAGRHEIRLFLELPKDEQERRIVAAQAFPAEAMGSAPAAPAHGAPPPPPPWLGGDRP